MTMQIKIGMRVALTKSYVGDMESFLAGERGVVTGIDGADLAMVRMDQDDLIYPLPKRILAPSGVHK